MKKHAILIITATLIACLINPALAGEKDVLKALEIIKGNVESGVNLSTYRELLADAKVEINIYKRGKNINSDFLNATKKCLTCYQSAGGFWKMKLDFERLKSYEDAIDCDQNMQEDWQKASDYLDKAYEAL